MTLKHGLQGQPRSNVKTNLNSQHMVSYLLPIQYGHLSLTVWPQHAIYPCVRKRMTLNFEFQDQHRSNVKVDLNSQHIMVSIVKNVEIVYKSYVAEHA